MTALRRIGCSFVGLLAGNGFLLLYLLGNAIATRQELLRIHMGEPHIQLSVALQMFVIYLVFAIAGWVVVGIPFALSIPARTIVRLRWWMIPIGAVAGALSLFLIFAMMAHGRVDAGTFRNTGMFFVFALVISVVAAGVYLALLRQGLGDRV